MNDKEDYCNFCFQVWFQNRRAKFRKQERLAQQKATNSNGDGSSGQPNIKAENSSSTTKSNLGGSKDIKPGSPHSGISTTPNSNTSASSHQSSSNGDIKPMNGKYTMQMNIRTLYVGRNLHARVVKSIFKEKCNSNNFYCQSD